MSRQFSSREIRLLMILPAMAIAGVYAFAFERPYRQQLDGIRQATTAILRNPVPPSKLQDATAEIASLTAQIDQEQKRAAAATQPSLILPSYWTTSAGRLNAVADIASTFASHSVIVVQSSHQPGSAVSGIAPQSLQDFVAAIVHEGHSPVPEVWKIDLIGSYADVLKALGEFGHCDAFIMPLGISMESIGEDTNYRRWSLWVWV